MREAGRFGRQVGRVHDAPLGAGTAAPRGEAVHGLPAEDGVARTQGPHSGTDFADDAAEIEAQDRREGERRARLVARGTGAQLQINVVDCSAVHFYQNLVVILDIKISVNLNRKQTKSGTKTKKNLTSSSGRGIFWL